MLCIARWLELRDGVCDVLGPAIQAPALVAPLLRAVGLFSVSLHLDCDDYAVHALRLRVCGLG